jgi:hypothetical protein
MLIYLLPMLAFVALAISHHLKLGPSSHRVYLISLLLLAAVAGIRFQVGQDWDAYEAFFNEINTQNNPFTEFFSGEHQQFEIGFHILNFLAKTAWNNYQLVFIISAFTLSICIYTVTPRLKLNHFYILTIYLSYSYLILNFAQVRQAIAISFTLLGIYVYSKTKNSTLSLATSLLGAIFQYSSLMYTLIFALAIHINLRSRKSIAAILIAAFVLFLLQANIEAFELLGKLALTAPTHAKVEIYKESQLELGQGQAIYSIYLAALTAYLYSRLALFGIAERPFINFAILSSTLAVFFTVIFPGSYVMYSRVYVIACFFHALCFSMIKAKEGNHRAPMTEAVFYFSLVMAIALYIRILLINQDAYFPYKSFLTYII